MGAAESIPKEGRIRWPLKQRFGAKLCGLLPFLEHWQLNEREMAYVAVIKGKPPNAIRMVKLSYSTCLSAMTSPQLPKANKRRQCNEVLDNLPGHIKLSISIESHEMLSLSAVYGQHLKTTL